MRLHHNRQEHQLFSPPVIRRVSLRASRQTILLDSLLSNHRVDRALNRVLIRLGNPQKYRLVIQLANLQVSLPGSPLVSQLASRQDNLQANLQCNLLDNRLRSHQVNLPGSLVRNLQESQARNHLVSHLVSQLASLVGNLLVFQVVNLQVLQLDSQQISHLVHLRRIQQQQPRQIHQ